VACSRWASALHYRGTKIIDFKLNKARVFDLKYPTYEYGLQGGIEAMKLGVDMFNARIRRHDHAERDEAALHDASKKLVLERRRSLGLVYKHR
jgi:hypothetical protein